MKASVITVDGPAASGKGTVGAMLSQALGWRHLESGALYRMVALLSSDDDQDNIDRLVEAAKNLQLDMRDGSMRLCGLDDHRRLYEVAVGERAAIVARIPEVRVALMGHQRACRQPPGLVAEGRDMGTVVFPDADMKIYLTARLEERARRRFRQLKDEGKNVNIEDVVREIRIRDERDSTREASPLKPAADADCLDSSQLNPKQVTEKILQLWQQRK